CYRVSGGDGVLAGRRACAPYGPAMDLVGSVHPTLHSSLFTHCCHNNGHFFFFPVYLGQENKICSGKGDVPLGKEDYG
ncbi:hypothetical protein, partial [Acidaminococcus fermentans]|uniref:hypothetical protein n=1 Tax=Acidaminococcus fermentans TaxID=905 RepID=UPI00242DB0E7